MEGFGLADALGNLAQELVRAQSAAQCHRPPFEIVGAEVEFSLEAGVQVGGGASFRVVRTGADSRVSRAGAHQLRLVLDIKDFADAGVMGDESAHLVSEAAAEVIPGAPRRSSEQVRSERDRTGAIEPLTIPLLRQRLVDTYSAGYLTVIAIIQGVALGILLTTSQHELLKRATFPDHVAVAAQATATFAAIVIVTHQYLILTALVRWTPTALDTIIPYALGVGEIGAALLLGKNVGWWGSFSVLNLVAVGAFVYSLIRGSAPVFGDLNEFHVQYRQSLRLQIASCAILALFCLVMAVLSSYGVGAIWFFALAPFGVTAGGMAVEILGDRDQDDVFVRGGIPWWRFRSSLDDLRTGARKDGQDPA